MTKSEFWKTDWFLGIVIVIAFALFNRFSDLIPSLERKAYDMGVQITSRVPSDRVAVIAIDDTSIGNIGRWPWSREVHARMADLLAGAKAKVVANTALFTEPQLDPGYRYITQLLELANRAPPPVAEPNAPAAPAQPAAELGAFVALLKEAEQALNTDRKFGESVSRAGNVVLPMRFEIGIPQGRPDKPLPDYVKRMAVPGPSGELLATKERGIQVPIAELGRGAAMIGHFNSTLDSDGYFRYEPLLLSHFDESYPSISLAVVLRALNLGPKDVRFGGDSVSVGRLRIGTDGAALMYPFFYRDRDGRAAFAADSYYDVHSGKIPVEKYRDKIVLIGVTDPATDKPFPTPISAAMPGVLILAHSVSSILQEHFFVVPAWAYGAELLAALLVAAYLVALMPRLKAGPALAISGGIFAALLLVHFALMVGAGLWLQLMLALTLLLVGHAALVSKRFIVTERAKVKSDESSAESNRMLGLAYQGQGLLDQAWDKFRQVPMSDALLDNLYNLALDFERKRQFNKAESVFRHMYEFNPKFRDLEQRLSRAKQLSETVMLGGAAAAGRSNVSILGAGDSVEKPMLGRYQVEKELGKGAMGVVYLGKDPKIGRIVAIKTMALSQEFEADELAEVKERFFREAEAAGRLSHPDIVTIYDAGEEHDLCYIAMELLKGGDLVPFCKAGKLLPAEKAASIVARAAEALDYAHGQGVVHRDIKPANMMYDPGSDTLKLTDFGIARLTDSSKTKTGMVLGTPSYMSPEQLAGKKIEGRSDLFSLAVSLYQLLSGKLPFEGDSMAQLMFKIASEPPTGILTVSPDVPPGVPAFLERALAKNPDDRFRTGAEFAAELRAALTGSKAAVAAPASTQVDIEL